MLGTGERLKEERTRLGLSQQALATATGVSKKSQTNYELGHSDPPAAYLAAAAAVGVDVQYVLTNRPAPAPSSEEAELLRRYRSASPEIRAAVFAALGAVLVPPSPSAPAVAISGGKQGQVLAGNAQQDGLTINVGRQKRGKKK